MRRVLLLPLFLIPTHLSMAADEASPTKPIDLRTGRPATEAPPGSIIIKPPQNVSGGDDNPPKPGVWGKAGTTNEGVSPERRKRPKQSGAKP